MPPLPTNTLYGMLNPATNWGEYNGIYFAIKQAIVKMQTATIVQVLACSNDGGVSPFGTVDVQPMVNQIDGNNPPNSVAMPPLYGLPYLRIQGGSNAIIIDPQVGDLGIAVFASRDISNVQANQAQSNPGSWRTYDLGDGMYLGGLLNQMPLQYIQFNDNGISIVSPTAVTINAPGGCNIVGPVTANGLAAGNLTPSSGANGTFSTGTGQTVTVQDGIIISF